MGKSPETTTYCECRWTEFRKRFSAAELGDEATVASDRFVAARTPVVEVCGNKMLCLEGAAQAGLARGSGP